MLYCMHVFCCVASGSWLGSAALDATGNRQVPSVPSAVRVMLDTALLQRQDMGRDGKRNHRCIWEYWRYWRYPRNPSNNLVRKFGAVNDVCNSILRWDDDLQWENMRNMFSNAKKPSQRIVLEEFRLISEVCIIMIHVTINIIIIMIYIHNII